VTAPLLTGDEFSLWLWDDVSGEREIVPYVDAGLDGGRYLSGSGSVRVPASSTIASLFMGSTPGREFELCSLRAFYRDATAPLWSGPVSGAQMRSTGDRGYVDILFEEFCGHFLRRRQVLEDNLDPLAFAAALTAADNIALALMRYQIGPASLGIPHTPSTYPVGVSRTDFTPFTPDVAADHSPGLSSSTPAIAEQSGTSLQELIEQFCEQEDLALLCADNLDGTFDLDTDCPFQVEDVSASVVFGQWYGNLASFEATTDLQSLANVWCLEGASKATHVFVDDSTSIGVRGVFEAKAQKPQDSASSGDVTSSAGWLLSRHKDGTITYKAELLESAGCRFNADWGRRSKIGFDEAVYGYQFAQVVQEWSCKAENGGPPRFSFVCGVPKLHYERELADFVGTRGPRFGGGRWRDKRGH